MTWFALSTGLLANVTGLQASLDQFGRWLGDLGAWGRPDRLFHLRLLLAYELLPLTFGLIGAGYYLRRRDPWAGFLVYWAAGSFLLHSLTGPSEPANVALTALPLILLSSMLLDRLVLALMDRGRWDHEGLFLILAVIIAMFAYLQLGGYASSGNVAHLRLVGAGVILSVGLAVFFWYWMGEGPALRSMGIALLVLLGLWTAHLSWQVNYEPRAQPNELLARVRTSDDVLRLADALATISNDREGARHLLEITVHQDLTPELAWYLRDFENTRFVEELGSDTGAPAVVVPAEGAISLPEGYIGQKFRLSTRWDSAGISRQAWVKWFLYREAPRDRTAREMILYVRR